jgi:DNA invertase Pin-like site-specific DNA recombinase
MLDRNNLPTPIMAAQYVRMSTDQQRYSTENQTHAIREYAEQHNMVVVRTYIDAGRSGLTFSERPALRSLLADAEKGSPGYSVVLVYDVSRWGRFQDADESAYYEYRCRRSRIAVHYCAEPFANDGGITGALIKALKRAMAAEYSRELSVKVFAGKARLIELGFRQGGWAGYGLRRLLIDQNGKPKFVLKEGEEKSIATDRVVLIPGPPEEVELVNEIFEMYASKDYSPADIAAVLTRRGLSCTGGRSWTRHLVRSMLSNPKYIGTNVSNRHSSKLHGRTSTNSPELWIKKEQAFPAIVNSELFARAQAVATLRARFLTEEEMLQHLRDFLARHGTITARKINADWNMPCPQAYTQRFGSLMAAYTRIGFRPRRDMEHSERDREVRLIRRAFREAVVNQLRLGGSVASYTHETGLIHLNRGITVRAIVARCNSLNRTSGWILRLRAPRNPDFTLIARLAPGNKEFLDYLLLPKGSYVETTQVKMRTGVPCRFEQHRFETLAFLDNAISASIENDRSDGVLESRSTRS